MTTAIARQLAVVAAIGAAMLVVRGASFLDVHDPRAEVAWVRLSWSARPERVEQCRRLSDAELAERPAHMRLRVECEGRFARYQLHLTVDGAAVRLDTIEGGGWRHDRPMHVLDEAAVSPGTRRLVVRLVRIDSVRTDSVDRPAVSGDRGGDSVLGEREGREREERTRRAGEEIPSPLTLDTVVTLRPGQVLLITYDGTRRALATRTGGG